MNPDDVGSGARPPTEGTSSEVGVGVLASVANQGVFTAVGPGAFLALECFDGGGSGSPC